MEPISRKSPERTLSKEQAVRHLIHAAVRMIGRGEDPYAIHMLVQSADKMLIDLSEKMGKPLVFSWSEYIKPEYVRELMTILRETYNFFKHADKDHDKKLGVINIAQLNVMELAVCSINFHTLFNCWTEHMRLFHSFASMAVPESFVPPADREAFDNRTSLLRSMTPIQFFQEIFGDRTTFGNLEKERLEDLQDNGSFYSTAISELSRF